MNFNFSHSRFLILVYLLILMLISCGKDNLDDNGNDDNGLPPNTPTIPVPSYPGEVLPERSDSLIFEEALIDNFSPTLSACPDTVVQYLESLKCTDVILWPADKRFDLVVDGANVDLIDVPVRAFTKVPHTSISIPFYYTFTCRGIVEIPTLQHIRYWQKIFSTVIQYPSNYLESHTYTEGTSETWGQSFSYTLGLSGSVWGIGLSAELTKTFSHSITVTSESSVTKQFSANSIQGKTIVFTTWQLIEAFRICNADSSVYSDPTYDMNIPMIDNGTNNLYLSTVEF